MKHLYGLIGHPLGHSISGEIHRRLYEYYQMDAEYRYFDLEEEEIGSRMNDFRQNFSGLNVTIPYKKKILSYLDDVRDDGALFGAVNTVVLKQGKAIGYNTDGMGFMKLLKQNRISVQGKRICILGAGGAGSALAPKIAGSGAEEIVILNRSLHKADEVAERIRRSVSCTVRTDFPDLAGKYLKYCDVLVNTTSVGMSPRSEELSLEAAEQLRSETAVVDIIYNPRKTKLLQIAEQNGCTAINGLGMLLYQAFYAFELWTGLMPPEALEQQLEHELVF